MTEVARKAAPLIKLRDFRLNHDEVQLQFKFFVVYWVELGINVLNYEPQLIFMHWKENELEFSLQRPVHEGIFAFTLWTNSIS
jgi:hypothetical protein